jgi:hypothetical protein
LYLDADYTQRGGQCNNRVGLCSFIGSLGGNPYLSVDFGKIHAVGKLQPGDLPRVELHFQISLQDGDVEGFALRRTRALGTDPVEFHVAVMSFYKFIYDRIHD